MRKRVSVIMTGAWVLLSLGSMQAMSVHSMRLGCSDDQLDLLIAAIEKDSRYQAQELLQEGMPLHAVVRAEFCARHRTENLADMDYMDQSPLYVMTRADKPNILRLFLERGLFGPAVDQEISRAWCRRLPQSVLRLFVLAGINFDNLGPCQGPHFPGVDYPNSACGRHNQETRADIESAKEERLEIMAHDDTRYAVFAALLFLPRDLAFLICDYRTCVLPEDKTLVAAPKVIINIPVALPGEYAP